MEAIQLAILALLVNCLGGTTTTNFQSTVGSERTNPTSSSLHDSATLTPATPLMITSMSTVTSGPSSDLPSNTSILTNTPSRTSQLTSKTSQFTSKISPEVQSIQSSPSQPTSYVTNINQTSTPITIKSTPITIKSTPITKSSVKYPDNATAGKIVAYVIGVMLLLMLIIICILLMRRRCSKYPVQDLTWAGAYPGPSEDGVHATEDNDNNVAPAKRPSLTTFLSKKSKRESLLDQYSMEVQESEGIINASSSGIEEKLIEPEVKVENETEKEIPSTSETHEIQSQVFPPSPPLEAQVSLNGNDPAAPLPATDTDAPSPPQEVPDVDPNITSFPPPPFDFLDLVNDSDFPPPLTELQA
ncbi:protein EVI2B-like [Carcharodon carcharias]|uniref:protein EVI2B-like n=1 Tax=Carcharodon carcharias TaxID=13397 RepID=UPI001B7E4F7F|nr:protein EVI2B-like [Carcharodon carcharias]XP_041054192.1 protein EVI2B-like [Carcharodon carcharias]